MSTTFRSMPPLAAMSSGRRERASSTTDQTSTSGPIFTSQFLLRGNDGAEPSGKLDTVVIVLNWVLPQCTTRLMSSARMRICADGGANQLYDELPRRAPDAEPDALREQYAPDAITGDMDSARAEVLEFYRRRGTEVVDLADDQDSTDLQKCIAHVERRFSETDLQRMTILVLGAMGGRIDHTLSNLNTLLMHAHLDLVLLGDNSTARLLPAGSCSVRPAPGIEGPACSLVPIAGPAIASSSGLKWNLEDTKMAFGGLISTSNVLTADTIHVHSDVPLLWTTDFLDRT